MSDPRPLDRRSLRLLSAQFLRFGLVGVAGFLVDAGVLRGLISIGFGLYSGRIVSFLAAATATWLLNRSFTFRRDAPSAFGHPAAEWAGYLSLMVLGGLVNYGTYSLAVNGSETVHRYPEIGVALGSLAGMAINFWSAKRMIFERPQRGS
ncbi:MAG TPA: GtrA family protein [Dongiaceae bacterium]|nr:GtrA family protein [Dongiaceae bacterium]